MRQGPRPAELTAARPVVDRSRRRSSPAADGASTCRRSDPAELPCSIVHTTGVAGGGAGRGGRRQRSGPAEATGGGADRRRRSGPAEPLAEERPPAALLAWGRRRWQHARRRRCWWGLVAQQWVCLLGLLLEKARFGCVTHSLCVTQMVEYRYRIWVLVVGDSLTSVDLQLHTYLRSTRGYG